MFKYSIIVCAYNEEEHIAKCLESLLLQNFDSDKYEILVINNSSTDKTFEKAKKTIQRYSDRKVSVRLVTIKHVGLSASRNTALGLVKSQYVSFIDGDAFVDQDWLKHIEMAVLTSEPNEKIFSGSVENLNTLSRFSEFLYNAHVAPALNASNESKLIGANMTFDRSVFNDIQFLDGLRRGDESCLVGQLKQINPLVREKHVAAAIVFNDYPASILEWTKVLFTEGCMRYLIDGQILKSKQATNKTKMFFRFIFLTSFLFLSISAVTTGLSAGGLFICFVPIFIRLWGARIMIRNAIFENVRKRRVLTGVLSPLFALYNFFIRDLAFVVSAIFGKNTPFVPVSSKSEVLDVFVKPSETK